jgi:hypothetical protein
LDQAQEEAARLIDSAFESSAAEPLWKAERSEYADLWDLFDEWVVRSKEPKVLTRNFDLLLENLVGKHVRVLASYTHPYTHDVSTEHASPFPVAAIPEQVQTVQLEDLVRLLRSNEWEFRTVPGLAVDLGVPPSAVEHVLDEFPELVRRLPALDKDGNELLAYAGHPPSWTERMIRLRAYFGKLS